MDVTQQAFTNRDDNASRAAHTQEEIAMRINIEGHSAAGGKLKSIVYGGLDGIITTFAVVAAANGGDLDKDVVLIMGISNMFADALSMGLGDAISTKAENEMIIRERDREAWEVDNYLEGEKTEMVEIYTARGLGRDQAVKMVDAMSTNVDFFADQMMSDELGMTLPGDDDNPLIDGAITSASFVSFGVVPLLIYIALKSTDVTDDTLFGISCGATSITLFVLGVVKSQFTRQSWYKAGFEILGVGSAAAAVSYGVGYVVAGIV
jgi:DNA damage-binding protein 1